MNKRGEINKTKYVGDKMRSKNRIFVITIFLILFTINVVAENNSENVSEPYSEVLLVNNVSGVEYQSKILEEFNKTSKVTILVKLHSNNITKLDEMLSNLSQTEFKLESKLPLGNGFGGNITKQGFDNLINNPDVKAIYLDELLHIVMGNVKREENVSEIIKNNSISNNILVLEKEQRLGTPSEAYNLKDIEKLESNNILLVWLSIFILIIIVYLIVKFRKK